MHTNRMGSRQWLDVWAGITVSFNLPDKCQRQPCSIFIGVYSCPSSWFN